MMLHKYNEKRMELHYIQQLHKLEYYETDGLTIDQLKNRLTLARMKNIDYENSNNVWFN